MCFNPPWELFLLMSFVLTQKTIMSLFVKYSISPVSEEIDISIHAPVSQNR
jgi:hypothetical protein